jgi:cytochrome c oxidase subunit II
MSVDTVSIFGYVFRREVLIACIVFALICVWLFFGMWLSHRKKRTGRPPSTHTKNTRLELSYAAVVAAIAVYVIYLSFHTANQENQRPRHVAAHVVVTGFQWCWRFSYPGHHQANTSSCIGRHHPVMVVPVGETIEIRTHSSDVIHSWWVPALRYKMDAFPDHTNTFTLKITQAGRWAGRCAEYCGQFHYAMDFTLAAVPMSTYRKWLATGGPVPGQQA